MIKYWMNNMNEVKKFQGHKGAVRAISFAPSDLKFVSGGDDCLLKLWDFETGKEEKSMKGHHYTVRCAAWHPFKPLILSGGKDHKVKLWDARMAKCLDTIHGHKKSVECCAWTNNGNSFVTGGSDQKLKLYDLRRTSESLMTWNCQAPMGGNKNEVTAVAMHPHDETLFASGDYHGTINFWHVNSEEPVAVRASGEQGAHEQCTWSLAWHPLGHILCSGSNDHTC
jgi:polyadenylation factor subunit 2